MGSSWQGDAPHIDPIRYASRFVLLCLHAAGTARTTYLEEEHEMTATTAAPVVPTTTREEWLMSAVGALTPLFEEVGEAVPAVRVSVGWPGGRGNKNSVIGQCWNKAAAADEVAQIFISPVLEDGLRVLDVLAHELVHAIDENKSGHKGNFARIAKAIGLEGKMTATVAGEALKERLTEVIDDLGAYPHAALSPALAGGKKQTTRMLKVECPESGYIARTTAKWLDAYGAPKCPCHDEVMQIG